MYYSIIHYLYLCIVCSPPKVESPSITIYLTPFTLFTTLSSPSPSDNHHSVVSVNLSVLFVHLLLFVLYPTYEWSHVVLVLFNLFSFFLAWYSEDPSMLSQMAVFRLFLWLSSIPLYVYHIFYTQSSIKGHLGCFHVLATINNAEMNTGIHISLW